MPRGGPPRSNKATVLSSKEISSSLNLSLSLFLSLGRGRWNYDAVPRLETNSFSSAKLTLVVPRRHGGINFWNSLIVVSAVWKVVGCQVESSRLHCRTERKRESEKGEGEGSVFLLFLRPIRQFESRKLKSEWKLACSREGEAVDPLGEGLRFKWPPPTSDPRQPSPIRRELLAVEF